MKEIKEYIDEYLNTLTEKQKIAYNIAVDMLGTSFDVEKSLGFKKWMKQEKNFKTSLLRFVKTSQEKCAAGRCHQEYYDEYISNW